jgi:hypothetical protein
VRWRLPLSPSLAERLGDAGAAVGRAA